MITWERLRLSIRFCRNSFSEPDPIIRRGVLILIHDLINKSKPFTFSSLPTATADSPFTFWNLDNWYQLWITVLGLVTPFKAPLLPPITKSAWLKTLTFFLTPWMLAIKLKSKKYLIIFNTEVGLEACAWTTSKLEAFRILNILKMPERDLLLKFLISITLNSL